MFCCLLVFLFLLMLGIALFVGYLLLFGLWLCFYAILVLVVFICVD